MSRVHLVIPDQHAHPEHSNDRFDWLGRLILDLRPDVIINIGDAGDFSSLSSYDKGKRSFVGKSYQKDVEAFVEGQDRTFAPIKRAKKRLPESYFFIGNHEQRIDRALDASPELEGTIGYGDLQLDAYYDEVIYYDGSLPGIRSIDGIEYAHFFPAGVSGRAISGEHPGYALLTKRFTSSTQGHTHVKDYCQRTQRDRKIHGLVAGVYQDYRSDWAGPVNGLWWSGVVIKREVEDGNYEPEFVSINRLRKEYGVA